MNKIIRWYNRNRKTFWLIIVLGIIVISLPRILNKYAKDKKNVSSSEKNTTTYNAIQKPAITGKIINEDISKKSTNIIDSFINYCNSGNTEYAYNLLSQDCKMELYPTIDKFINNYYNKTFAENMSYDIETWISNENTITYRVSIIGDRLSTGNANELSIQDYYTIVKENNEYKLNISSYIGKQEINTISSIENLNIEIIEKYVYVDYQIYKFKINNSSDKKIMLDSKKNTRSVNVIDQNNVKYVGFLNELSENELTIESGMSKEIKIKFNKSYNPKYLEKYIEFSDIIDEENNKKEIKIEL